MVRPHVALAWIACLLLVACSSGPVRRISQPAASIQQLTVDADGGWSVDLRVQNFSSIAMRFDTVRLELASSETSAGTLEAAPQLSIAGEAVDVITLQLTPSPEARLLLADVLAGGRSLPYSLRGELAAAPADRGRSRDYRVERTGVLSPVPGLPGVLR